MRKFETVLLFLLVVFLNGCMTISRPKPALDIPRYTVIFCFDDGPNPHEDTTVRLLDVLKKYQVQAIFTLFGERAEAYPELVMRIHNEGHYIVNHGYSDNWVIRMNVVEFRRNLLRGEAAIAASLGKELYPKLYRPHGGFYTSRHKAICIEEGYDFFFSDLRVYDAVISGSKQNRVVQQVIKKVKRQKRGIILLHDARDSYSFTERNLERYPYGSFNRSWIPDAVEEIIIALLENGFRIGSPAYVIPNNF